ncbi:MAG: outer membrane chaperone Skp [Flammeovirgaceae bacterium]|nr:outer membrane chaperone Skp [Flammeovirgaceae bacterium]MBR07306.1 outer membrane chaperone Skp [Rickettsiales bacterium]HCX23206.1 outer membrane chaperone Skp [Cytophagales bacterium]|tara:strand:- start:1212 stop:1760 length:549 start_codon:yes stop_codon:yes gene_type:complete
MKTKVLSLLVILMAGAFTLTAQDALKIGYTNADYILSLLPEAKQIDSELKAYEKQLQNQIQAKYNDLQAKMADYQENAASWDDLIRSNKEEEIQGLQQGIQKFSQDAEQSMANKRNQLLKPVYEKIGNAIESVAKENNYSHIFSAGTPGFDVLLYAREQDDVSNLILKKLGITPPAAAAQGN